jgi:hypothetical protein
MDIPLRPHILKSLSQMSAGEVRDVIEWGDRFFRSETAQLESFVARSGRSPAAKFAAGKWRHKIDQMNVVREEARLRFAHLAWCARTLQTS